MPRYLSVALLVVVTMLWGFAFVAQKTAMDVMPPLTFVGIRFLIGGFVVLPLAVWEWRRRKAEPRRQDWSIIALIALVFFLGNWLQQAGLVLTTVTNAGFLTGLYVLMVPLLALVALRQVPHALVWLAMPMALAGLYLLNGGRLDSLNPGDALIIGCAVCWAIQVLLIGAVSKRTGLPVTISAICFLATGLLSTTGAFVLEAPDLAAVLSGWKEILYAGILSTAVAFTLQAIAQQHMPASNAAIVLSGEALFAALAGAVVLGERLPAIGYAGAALIFAAILVVEAVPALARARRPSSQDPRR